MASRLRVVGKDESMVRGNTPVTIVAKQITTLSLSDGTQALLMLSEQGVVYSLATNGGWLAFNMMEVVENGTV